jgi:hypothetical protein
MYMLPAAGGGAGFAEPTADDVLIPATYEYVSATY